MNSPRRFKNSRVSRRIICWRLESATSGSLPTAWRKRCQ